MELTDKEKEVLRNLIGKMNYYDMMAILCRTYEKPELEEACGTLIKIHSLLYREVQDESIKEG